LIGNYHDERSEAICRRAIEAAAGDPRNHLVILPKTRLEREFVASALPPGSPARVMMPERALPGLQLLFHSNLAISGGGTMNRESALLGVPTYSIFTGRRAAVDEELERMGRLTFLTAPEEVGMIEWSHTLSNRDISQRDTLHEISGLIDNLAAIHKSPNPTLPERF
jgi:predicted glycosyltransferase